MTTAGHVDFSSIAFRLQNLETAYNQLHLVVAAQGQQLKDFQAALVNVDAQVKAEEKSQVTPQENQKFDFGAALQAENKQTEPKNLDEQVTALWTYLNNIAEPDLAIVRAMHDTLRQSLGFHGPKHISLVDIENCLIQHIPNANREPSEKVLDCLRHLISYDERDMSSWRSSTKRGSLKWAALEPLSPRLLEWHLNLIYDDAVSRRRFTPVWTNQLLQDQGVFQDNLKFTEWYEDWSHKKAGTTKHFQTIKQVAKQLQGQDMPGVRHALFAVPKDIVAQSTVQGKTLLECLMVFDDCEATAEVVGSRWYAMSVLLNDYAWAPAHVNEVLQKFVPLLLTSTNYDAVENMLTSSRPNGTRWLTYKDVHKIVVSQNLFGKMPDKNVKLMVSMMA